MNRQFVIEWPDFNAAIRVELLDDENRNICDAFWNGLPFKSIFAGSMSAGEMLKLPVPFPLPPAPPEKNVFFPDLPPGVFISMGYGGLLLKYGICAEPFRFPQIARVLAEDMDKLRAVAVRLRDAYFFTKEINIATIRRS